MAALLPNWPHRHFYSSIWLFGLMLAILDIDADDDIWSLSVILMQCSCLLVAFTDSFSRSINPLLSQLDSTLFWASAMLQKTIIRFTLSGLKCNCKAMFTRWCRFAKCECSLKGPIDNVSLWGRWLEWIHVSTYPWAPTPTNGSQVPQKLGGYGKAHHNPTLLQHPMCKWSDSRTL